MNECLSLFEGTSTRLHYLSSIVYNFQGKLPLLSALEYDGLLVLNGVLGLMTCIQMRL